jgi:hypothetical protein
MATKGDIAFGDEARDTITGRTGVVVSLTDGLNGCQRKSPVCRRGSSCPLNESLQVNACESIRGISCS